MRIQHNIPAMNAYRNFGNNSKAINKNLEKLSSGYKINRAGDDAAGLAISEKMRAQITGLEVAQKNAKDGISLIQTAEGALTEVHDMLNRMVTLAEQSANGTYADNVDREQLQKEVKSLKEEIDRIGKSANFNGTKLLNGNLSGVVSTGSSSAGNTASPALATEDGTATAANVFASVDSAVTFDAAATDDDKAALNTALANGESLTFTSDGTGFTGSTTLGSYTVSYDYNDDADTDGTNDRYSASSSGTATIIDSSNKTIATFNFTLTDGNALSSGDDASVKLTEGTAAASGSGSAGGASTNPTATIDSTSNANLLDATNPPTIAWDSSASDADKSALNDLLSNVQLTFTVEANGNQLDAAATGLTGYTLSWTGATTGINDTAYDGGDSGTLTISGSNGAIATVNFTVGGSALSENGGETATISFTKADLSSASGSSDTFTINGGGSALTLQIGDTSSSYDKMGVSIDAIDTNQLGRFQLNADGYKELVDESGAIATSSGDATKPVSIADVDISTQDGAAAAMDVIKAAINYVSDTRGGLGALQNRLEHTINNLSVMQENMQDAESTIRDTDVAEEMMKYTKNNILVQSAQAMLAQANQLPQGVLQLLQ